jgi:hypothetical protein
LTPPVFIEYMGDAVQVKVGTDLVGETVGHGPGTPVHLLESPLKDVSGPDGFQPLRRKT